jgi:hypothetical protein
VGTQHHTTAAAKENTHETAEVSQSA